MVLNNFRKFRFSAPWGSWNFEKPKKVDLLGGPDYSTANSKSKLEEELIVLSPVQSSASSSSDPQLSLHSSPVHNLHLTL